jgi:hypothetical protein
VDIKKEGKLKKAGVIVFLVSLIFLAGLIFIKADDEMTVEANFTGYSGGTFSIQVPDYIFLGEVSPETPFTETSKTIRINNTGSANAIVTPELASNSPEVFNYLYFRKQKSTSTNDTSLIEFHKIGEYSINVNKKDDTTFYVSLNLTDFKKTLPSDDINLSTIIKFVGMAA